MFIRFKHAPYICCARRECAPGCELPYSQKYWRELNLAVESQIAITNILVRFKLGGSVQNRHTFICMEEILADFNLAVGRPTAKPPNLNHRQISDYTVLLDKQISCKKFRPSENLFFRKYGTPQCCTKHSREKISAIYSQGQAEWSSTEECG